MKQPTKPKKLPAPQDALFPVKSTGFNTSLMSQKDHSILLTDWKNLCPQKHGGLAAYCINKSSKSSADLFKKIYSIYQSTELSWEQYSFIAKLMLYALSSASCTQIMQPHSKSYLAVLSILTNKINKLNFTDIRPNCIEAFSSKASQFHEKQDRYYFSIYIICMAEHAGIRESNGLSNLRKYISAYKSQQTDFAKVGTQNSSGKTIVPSNTGTPSKSTRMSANLKKNPPKANIMNSNMDGTHIQKSCLILPEKKNSILNTPPIPKPLGSSKKPAITSRTKNKKKGIIKLGKGVAYSPLKTESQLRSIRTARALKAKSVPVPVKPRPALKVNQIKNRKSETSSRQEPKPDKNWAISQPRYPTEPVITHSADFSFDKFREYSEARENHPKEDLGLFSELHDSSFLKQRGYDTNTTWEKRKQILDQADTYHEKEHIMKHLIFLISTRVNQVDGASKFAHAIEIWEHDLKYIQNMKKLQEEDL